MPPVVNLGISTGKFVDFSNNTSMLKNFLNQLQTTKSSLRTNGTAEGPTGLSNCSSTSSAGWKPSEEYLELKINSLGNKSQATKCSKALEHEPLQGSYVEMVAQVIEGPSTCSSASFLGHKQSAQNRNTRLTSRVTLRMSLQKLLSRKVSLIFLQQSPIIKKLATRENHR